MMNTYTMTVGQSSSVDDIPHVYVRGVNPDGSVIEEEMTRDEWMACKVPPRMEYHLRITGFAVPFDQPNFFKGSINKAGMVDERDTVKKTKIDFQIVKRDGTLGAHVLIWCPWPQSLSPNSNLGRLFLAATQRDERSAGTASVTDMIGRDVRVMLMPSKSLNNEGQPKYAEIAWDTLAPWTGDVVDEDDPFL
jgi:hypothetical protein